MTHWNLKAILNKGLALMRPADSSANEFAVSDKRTIITAGYKVELELTNQVLAVTAPIDRDLDLGYRGDSPRLTEAPLKATLDSTGRSKFLSASVLAQKAKIFDDGLYAAVEVAAQNGIGKHAGKASLLSSLGRALAAADPSLAHSAQQLLLGAASLGHVPVAGVSPNIELRVREAVETFLADELRSKPIGFYTWSEQLRNIFQQDRMLQGEIDADGIKVIANALLVDLAAKDAYESHLRLISRLTNPFVNSGLRTFFPPSVAHETNIVKQLYGDTPIPEDFVLADEMIRQIRAGELNLQPRADSGW